MTITTKALTQAAAVALALASLAACGGGGSDPQSEAVTQPPTENPPTDPPVDPPTDPPPTGNAPPQISGSPAASVQASQAYSFQPAASDADQDTLTYSIANRPSWASFSTSTGRLSGTPTAAHVGAYPNIVVAVSDGRASASLPAFSINVTPAAGNSAPTIGGSPPTSVTAGVAYSFTPTASDADDDSLAFTVQNAPGWAAFDTGSGRLSGTPAAAQAGDYSNIVISVSDGQASASLPAFRITVAQPVIGGATLSWTPPTENTDGSALTDLAGYRIAYGTSPATLHQTIQVDNPGAASYVVTDLSVGTWYFAVKAYTSGGAESALSNVASKAIE